MSRYWMLLVVGLLTCQLCFAAIGSSDTRNRSVECYGDSGWTTRSWTQQCYVGTFPDGPGADKLVCKDSLTACGVQNPPVNSSATSASVGGNVTRIKYQSATSSQVCGGVGGSTRCWTHNFNGTQTTVSYQGIYPDNDGDSLIDSNDPDDDQDGIADISDNCPLDSNANQLNTDGDAQGNVCDADDDNDGVADVSDAFPLDAAESADTDHDGIGNNADLDDDGDGVPDYIDAAPQDGGNASERTLSIQGSYSGSAVKEMTGAP